MFVTLDLLLDGSPEGTTNWLVAGALCQYVSFDKLKKATRFVRINTSIAEIAQSVHKRRSLVREALYRLEGESRLQVVTEPTRGKNALCLNIGVDTRCKGKTKILFSPSLDVEYLFEMSINNAREAKTNKGKIRCLQYAHDVMKRSDHPEKAKWLTKLNQKIEELK